MMIRYCLSLNACLIDADEFFVREIQPNPGSRIEIDRIRQYASLVSCENQCLDLKPKTRISDFVLSILSFAPFLLHLISKNDETRYRNGS
jgi:hypothetical protein